MRRRSLAIGLGFLLCAAAVVPALACLWDADTLEMETQRFPDVLELLAGKFLRHSREFYRWRIEDRKQKLAADPEQLQYYDDLAVAYEKTGDHLKALETIQIKDKKKPNQYETLANLGTFYNLHADEIAQGLPYIKRAVAINPNAHFGRERYQIHVVEYVIAHMKDGKLVLPICTDGRSYGRHGFRDYLEKTKEPGDAIKGVLGMMRFANHDNPILLEALGDLLAVGDTRKGARQLAARAYLAASYVVSEHAAKDAYRKMAEQVVEMAVDEDHNQIKLDELEKQFQTERAEGGAFCAAIQRDELEWIKFGKDADVEFAKKYYNEPRMNNAPPPMADAPQNAPLEATPAAAASAPTVPQRSNLLTVLMIGGISMVSISTLVYFFAPKRKPALKRTRRAVRE